MYKRDYLRMRATQYVDEHYGAQHARLPEWCRENVRQNCIRKLLSKSKRRLFKDELADQKQTEWIRDYNTTVNRPKSTRIVYP
jgi:hypothetical protein